MVHIKKKRKLKDNELIYKKIRHGWRDRKQPRSHSGSQTVARRPRGALGGRQWQGEGERPIRKLVSILLRSNEKITHCL